MDWSELARRQAGVASRQQLLAAGYTPGRIDALRRGRRLQTTRWAGVYSAVGAPMTPTATQWAAVLDARAVLSYHSAAIWWELPVPADGRIHVTVPDRRRTRMPRGLRVHRVALAEDAVTECFGMPITTRVETLLDCLGWLPLRDATPSPTGRSSSGGSPRAISSVGSARRLGAGATANSLPCCARPCPGRTPPRNAG